MSDKKLQSNSGDEQLNAFNVSAISRRDFLTGASAAGIILGAGDWRQGRAGEENIPENKTKGRKIMLDLQLKGKRALVTGSTSGIGEATAKTFAQHGAVVTVHGRNEERGKRVVREITEAGGKAFLHLGDLRDDAAAERVAKSAVSAMGGVDILVNCAGEFEPIKFMDLEPQQWLDLYNNNVVSQVRMARLLIPQMRDLRWGRIINISSRGGTTGGEVAAHYSATKSGNIMLTVILNKTLKNTGITVNTISPGEVDTPGARRFFAKVLGIPLEKFTWEQAEEQGLRGGKWVTNTVGRYGKVDDIAIYAALLASPLSDWTSGQNFHIDGGSTVHFY